MPDTYLNPYTPDSPIGASLRNLAGIITKGPDEATKVMRAEAALKLKRENENTAGLGDMFRRYGTPDFNPAAATDLAVRAGVSPAALGGYDRYNAATRYGAADPRTDNAAVGAGAAYGSTAAGFNANLDAANQRNQAQINEQRYQFDNKPVTIGTDQGPVIARQNEAYGQPAVEDLNKVKGNAARIALNSPGGLAAADDVTQRFIGAGEKGQTTPRNMVSRSTGQNYISYDGVTDARTNQPLPNDAYIANVQGDTSQTGLSGNSSVDSKVLESRVAAQTATSMIDRLTTSLSQPNAAQATGYVGTVARTFNDLRSQVEATIGFVKGGDMATSLSSPEAQQAVDGAVKSIFGNANFNARAQQLGIDSSILRSQIQDLAYMISKTQDPGGRVSVDDIRRAAETVGASIMDPQAAIPVLQDLKARINMQQSIRENVTRQMYPQLRGGSPADAQAAPGAAPPPSAAPGAPQTSDPLAEARAAIARGADRSAVIRRLQQNGINPAGL